MDQLSGSTISGRVWQVVDEVAEAGIGAGEEQLCTPITSTWRADNAFDFELGLMAMALARFVVLQYLKWNQVYSVYRWMDGNN
jgi:hypothetical protein